MYQRAIVESFIKLNPRWMVRNPVMFVVEVGSVLTTALWIQALAGQGEAPTGFIGAIALWLWFTVLFANFSEAVAEGRGKAQAESLRKARQDTPAKKSARAAQMMCKPHFRKLKLFPPLHCARTISISSKQATFSLRMARS